MIKNKTQKSSSIIDKLSKFKVGKSARKANLSIENISKIIKSFDGPKTIKTTNNLSYAAALIESEGSLVLSKTKNKKNGKSRYEASLFIRMNNKEPIEFMSKLFGTKWTIGSKKINIKTKQFYSPAYCVSFRAIDKLKQVLESVLPYLKFKHEQAQTLLDFISLKQSYNDLAAPCKLIQFGQYNNLYRRSRALKQKGWIIPK